ncbi:MAG: DUF4350 domain-containing protein [Nostocales cyanobacterium]|nr:MAG: DUF4350 domain-containing protein [Nostocales cyanobacterium]TAF18559.1 MAG: DUF4350 domain-containing protein [Nostocales cyanobacterium]
MKRRQSLIFLGVITLAVMVLVSILIAPSNRINAGSTYNRAPDGYGAWYAFMQEQGANIQRWKKPFNEIKNEAEPVTLLQINSRLNSENIYPVEIEWIEKGNTLVVLGVEKPTTAAEFSTNQKSEFGDIKIDTTRRYKISKSEQQKLGDDFGAVVWEKEYGKGKVILSSTPYLAANAYQGEANFIYLAELINNNNQKILVDEYIHGYKDQDIREKERQGDLWSYFLQTPIIIILIQTIVLLLVLIWVENRRFGKPKIVKTPEIDNSQAYIQALAGVLQKATSSDFVLEMIGREERKNLQSKLGLGNKLLDNEVLVKIWQEKTSVSVNLAELEAVLKTELKKQRITEKELLDWLVKWQKIQKNHF